MTGRFQVSSLTENISKRLDEKNATIIVVGNVRGEMKRQIIMASMGGHHTHLPKLAERGGGKEAHHHLKDYRITDKSQTQPNFIFANDFPFFLGHRAIVAPLADTHLLKASTL